MPISPYFDHVGHIGQQTLVEDLIEEAIQHRGVLTYYIGRQTSGDLSLLNESTSNTFSTGVPIEMYIEEITNFNGQGDLFSAFGGFTLDDSVTFKVSARRFQEEMGEGSLPEAGDIIWLEFAKQAFEIQKRLEDEDYRQWGKNYTFLIKCTKFVYEGENMQTGLEDLDTLDDLVFGTDIDEPDVSTVEIPQDIRDEIEIDPSVGGIVGFGD